MNFTQMFFVYIGIGLLTTFAISFSSDFFQIIGNITGGFNVNVLSHLPTQIANIIYLVIMIIILYLIAKLFK